MNIEINRAVRQLGKIADELGEATEKLNTTKIGSVEYDVVLSKYEQCAVAYRSAQNCLHNAYCALADSMAKQAVV